MNNLIVILLVLTGTLWANPRSASVTVRSYMEISSPGGLSNVTERLSSSEIKPGEAEITYFPKDKKVLVFELTTKPNQSYTLLLPVEVNFQLSGKISKKIRLANFTSSPPPGAGMVGQGGAQIISLGLTRSAIPLDLPPGNYIGKIMIGIVY